MPRIFVDLLPHAVIGWLSRRQERGEPIELALPPSFSLYKTPHMAGCIAHRSWVRYLCSSIPSHANTFMPNTLSFLSTMQAVNKTRSPNGSVLHFQKLVEALKHTHALSSHSHTNKHISFFWHATSFFFLVFHG